MQIGSASTAGERRNVPAIVLEALDTAAATIGAVSLGLALRIGGLLWLGRLPLTDDALDYHKAGLALLAGERFEPDWPPGVPYFLAAAFKLLGTSAWASRLAMLALYPLFCAALYELACLLADRRAANLALFAFAIFPSYVYMSITPLSQLPAAVLLLGTAVLSLRLRHAPSWGNGLLLGMVLSALVLVRSSHVVLAVVLPVALAWRTRRLSVLAAPALVLALVVGAWTYKAREMTGRIVFINNANSQNMYYGNNPWTPLYKTWWFGSHKRGERDVPEAFSNQLQGMVQSPVADRGRLFSEAAWHHILRRPDLFAVRTASRVRVFFAVDSFTGAQLAKRAHRPMTGLAVIAGDGAIYLLIATVAIAWAVERRRVQPQSRDASSWVLVVVSLCAAPYFVSFSHPTYHFPVVPLIGVLAAGRSVRWLQGERIVARSDSWRGNALTWVGIGMLYLVQLEWVAQSVAQF